MIPFFIIGNPRSGTTLLRLMLASHSDLLVTPECGFALWLADEFSQCDISSNQVRMKYAEKVYACKKFDTWGIGLQDLKTHLTSSHAANYSELAAEVYHCYGKLVANKQYSRWGDKNNFYINRITQIANIYPDAQFIHIVRDGRDIACSYQELNRRKMESRFAPHLPKETKRIATEWRNNVLMAQTSLATMSNSRKMEVRFADLITSPALVLRKICHFLGVDYDNQMLKYYEINSEHQLEPEELLAWKEKILSPPQMDRVGRYKQDLKPEDIHQFERIAGDVLNSYGFSIDDE